MLTVSDASGNVVWMGEGSGAAGPNGLLLTEYELAGVGDGEALTLTVSAVDEDNKTVNADHLRCGGSNRRRYLDR